jgi:hypothetical protein
LGAHSADLTKPEPTERENLRVCQEIWILGAQGLGLLTGEWRGVRGTPMKQMVAAVTILVLAAAIMAYSSTLTEVK